MERMSYGVYCHSCYGRQPFKDACKQCGGKGYLIVEQVKADVPHTPAPGTPPPVGPGAGGSSYADIERGAQRRNAVRYFDETCDPCRLCGLAVVPRWETAREGWEQRRVFLNKDGKMHRCGEEAA